MPVTAHDIVVDALVVLNYIVPEEEPAARDYQTALGVYKNFHEWIRKEFTKKARWDYNAVDDRVNTYISSWLAKDLALNFPTSVEDINRVNAGADLAEKRLREILARESLDVTEAAYF